MPASIDYSDEKHVGLHTFEQTPSVPAGSWTNTQINASAAIDATKLKHQYAPVFSQVHGSAATSERRVIHVARSAGEVTAAEAGHVVAGAGGATVTVDVRKNGTSILTGATPISLTVAGAAYSKTTGSLNSSLTAYVAGDVFEIVLVATAGGGTLPQGVFADVVFREGA